MAPTIVVIGATGNTGKSVNLATLPQVEMQKDWATIDAAWLRSQEVGRVYIAPHNLPHQFVEESALHPPYRPAASWCQPPTLGN
ncbi:hypothetical protein ETB97_008471 [Aspergillus alliaceus]|uniref:Uncharacterized protein n=1 Tax=Petromyces alliaceus TaxID=209559 RepID=A0A8H6E220_PETAA|nr:hypothetical protein ETB97_008471 [Aspergillus burnettii]